MGMHFSAGKGTVVLVNIPNYYIELLFLDCYVVAKSFLMFILLTSDVHDPHTFVDLFVSNSDP